MPSTIKVKAQANPKNAKGEVKAGWVGDPVVRSGEFDVQVGNNLQENVALFGEGVVNSNFLSSLSIARQGVIRGMLENNKTPAEIQAYLNTYKPGMAVPKASKVVDFSKLSVDDISKMDFSTAEPEAIAALRAKIQQALAAKK